MQSIGTAAFRDFEGLLSWYRSLTLEAAADFSESLRNKRPRFGKDEDLEIVIDNASELYEVRSYASYDPKRTKEYQWPNIIQPAGISVFHRYQKFQEDMHQPIHVGVWDKEYAYLFLGNPKKGIVIPTPAKYMDFSPAADYSDMTPAALRQQLGGSGIEEMQLVSKDAYSTLTPNMLQAQKAVQEEQMQKLEQKIKDIEDCKTGELAELQQKIEAMKAELYQKKEAMLAKMEQMKQEMEEKKEALENQIFLLDAQIYSIRCFMGEVVKFGQIRSGKNASDKEPIVIHQKLRFLDEELGRLASLYEIQWNEVDMFEEFLRHSPLALDTFAPNERCITLVRLSRTATTFGRDDDRPYANLLKTYRYFHGKTVGIIIRNGENLYLGWTEEDRVHIDDDFIVSQVITEVVPDEEPEFTFESDRRRYIEQKKAERKQLIDGIVSRSFVFSILQGVVENTPLLPLPAGVKLGKQSEYVIYSVADKWLTDNKYGSFDEIIERCNSRVTEGDMLLTTQYLRPEEDHWTNHVYGTRAWENPRGVGDRNRTHDCSVEDCTLYPANLVMYDKPISQTRFRYWSVPNRWILQKNPDAQPMWRETVMDTGDYQRLKEREGKDPDVLKDHPDEIIEVFDYRKRHVFVSVKKKDNWSYSSEARANFEVYDEEFINLTYMNSVWLEWVITNRKLGGWSIGGKEVNYAYAIRYLKKAMDYITRREKLEKELLDKMNPAICKDPEWPLRLTEWKLEKGVRTLSPYQAKRFAKYITNRGKPE